ncbi:hypothetical protein ACK9YZ_05620 [Rhizobium sp. ZK1]|uniref:hypothetical protein n=1 Tax=Rhizobium sp. ZK1 TaxID=3389872 RepID=UPI0039F649C2
MEPVFSAILGALIAGATAASSDVASAAVKDAYEGLKQVLRDGYRFVSSSLLDTNPKDQAYQAAVESELKQHHEIANDPVVLDAVKNLQEKLVALPPPAIKMLSLDLERVTVGRDAILSHVSSLNAKDLSVARDLRVSGEDASGK